MQDWKAPFFKDYCGLDWDKITPVRAEKRFKELCTLEQPKKAALSLSPRNGYHVRVWFWGSVDTFHFRDQWRDDWFRMWFDINCNGMRDVLWTEKTIRCGEYRCTFREYPLIEWNPFDGFVYFNGFGYFESKSIYNRLL